MSGCSRREAEISNPLGLHLRTATDLARLSARFHAAVSVSCNGREASTRSILDLLMLAAECGARLEVEATGPDADAAAAAVCEFIAEGFHDGGI
jgi:phosphocarrier protein